MTSISLRPIVLRPRHKIAFLTAYIGTKYAGWQRAKGVPTVEGALLQAMVDTQALPSSVLDDDSKPRQAVAWTRSARTDRGVHAVGAVVAAKVFMGANHASGGLPGLVKGLNDALPEDIAVIGATRVTGGFHARWRCTQRHYRYLIPTWLAPPGSDVASAFEQGLSIFANRTAQFHAFTVGKAPGDPSTWRSIQDVSVGSGERWMTVDLAGSSFMRHQIRRMVGLALWSSVKSGGDPMHVKDSIERALALRAPLGDDGDEGQGWVGVRVPTAPPHPLFLVRCEFPSYDERFGKQTGLMSFPDAEEKRQAWIERIQGAIAEVDHEQIWKEWLCSGK